MKRQKVKWFGFLQFTVAELVFINFEVLSPEFYFVNSFRKAIFIIQNLKLLELFMLEYVQIYTVVVLVFTFSH